VRRSTVRALLGAPDAGPFIEALRRLYDHGTEDQVARFLRAVGKELNGAPYPPHWDIDATADAFLAFAKAYCGRRPRKRSRRS
jgi:hypothetical protein